MARYHVLYTADHNYFPHMLTSIYSLLEHHKEHPLTIHIIQENFTQSDMNHLDILNEIYDNVKVKTYSIDKLKRLMDYFQIPKWRGTEISNARLFASELINETDQILYLDSDTIIVHSLEELFKKRLKTPLGAVKEILIPPHLERLTKEFDQNKLTTYYNSGVLLLNYDLWEEERCLDDIYEMLGNTSKRLIYPDQDLLNLAFNEKFEPLELKYNLIPLTKDLEKHRILAKKFLKDRPFYYTYQEVMEANKNPCILHALSYIETRTWEENKINPFNQEYETYRTMWDPTFQKDPNQSKIAEIPFISDINLAVKTLFPEATHQKLKEKVRKKIS